MEQNKENTDKKMNSLIEQNDLLENYFRNTIIPQIFIDANLTLRKYTPPAMKHFNLTSDDIGRHINEISTNIRYPGIVDCISKVIESNKALEEEIQTEDKMWYQMNILPYIIQKENKANGVIITFVDITNRIEILKGHERLKNHYENIIYLISHDLKGPLSNIEGLVNMLLKKYKEDKVLNMLNTSVNNLQSVFDELKNTLKESDELQKANFEELLEDAKLALKDKITENNVVINSDLKISEIIYSKKNLRSILYNLLSNAIKYRSPERDPEIFIRTEKKDNFILLSVQDNGLGIEKIHHEKIFSRYARLESDVEGTGIGLFIVKRIVDDGGGEIEVESSSGKGSTFKVFFKGQ